MHYMVKIRDELVPAQVEVAESSDDDVRFQEQDRNFAPGNQFKMISEW